MSRLIIVAGPQAAGKSTIIGKIASQLEVMSPILSMKHLPLFFPMQESRQIIVRKHMLLGAIFMDAKHEHEVVSCDFERMALMQERNQENVAYLDECNVFTLAHARAHGIKEIEQYRDDYVHMLCLLQAAVIFLDVPPDVSWERRRLMYEKRLVYFPEDRHASIMDEYHEYLLNLHPLLLEVYDDLPLPKTWVNANCPEDQVCSAVFKALDSFL